MAMAKAPCLAKCGASVGMQYCSKQGPISNLSRSWLAHAAAIHDGDCDASTCYNALTYGNAQPLNTLTNDNALTRGTALTLILH